MLKASNFSRFIRLREENDEYRRNHYLSGLLHVQTKCEILKKKLSKDQCPIFRENV